MILLDSSLSKTQPRKPQNAPRIDLQCIRRTLIWSKMQFLIFTAMQRSNDRRYYDQSRQALPVVYRRNLCYTVNLHIRRELWLFWMHFHLSDTTNQKNSCKIVQQKACLRKILANTVMYHINLSMYGLSSMVQLLVPPK